MRVELDLEQEADFLLVTSTAEKLSPGIFTALVGDPTALEDQFTQLFEVW
jgi:hypothetical protein